MLNLVMQFMQNLERQWNLMDENLEFLYLQRLSVS